MNKGRHYTEDHFELPDNAFLVATEHPALESVTLHMPGYAGSEGHGFSIVFRPRHLKVLRELMAKLEQYEPPACDRSLMTAEDMEEEEMRHLGMPELDAREAGA